jgi:hypothetical protein
MYSKKNKTDKRNCSGWITKSNSINLPEVKVASKHKLRRIRDTYYSKRSKKYNAIYSPSPSNFVDLCSIDSTPDSKMSQTPSKKVENPYKTSQKETNVSIHQVSPSSCHDSKIVDLTLPPTIKQIKKDLPIFFTYDPNGEKDKSKVTKDYCDDCICPQPYCVDTLYGPLCYKHVEGLIARLGFDEYEKERDIKRSFRSIYTDLIKSKVLMNNISFDGVHHIEYMNLPSCIKNGNLHKLLRDVREWKERDEGWNLSDYDDEKESPLMKKFKPQLGYEQHNYDYSVDFFN